MKKAALIDALTTGQVSNAFEYSDELSLDSSDIKDFYEKDYAVILQREITQNPNFCRQ